MLGTAPFGRRPPSLHRLPALSPLAARSLSALVPTSGSCTGPRGSNFYRSNHCRQVELADLYEVSASATDLYRGLYLFTKKKQLQGTLSRRVIRLRRPTGRSTLERTCPRAKPPVDSNRVALARLTRVDTTIPIAKRQDAGSNAARHHHYH
jgi:hypothetical protein